jgi:predicted peptidase
MRSTAVYIRAALAAALVALLLSSALRGAAEAAGSDGGATFGRALIKPPPPEAESVALNRLEEIKKIPADFFEAHEFHAGNQVTLKYRLLRPKDYRPGVKYPLVVVFHGSGAIGDDNVQQLGVAAKGWAQDGQREKFPCFVLVPQFPSRSVLYVRERRLAVNVSVPLPPLYAAIELIEKLIAEFDVDRSRVYVIGFSMGGSATWSALALRPRMFAAAVAVSGMPDPRTAARIAGIPVWIIHGNRDDENPFVGDDMMYRALVRSGARRVRFWELDGRGHEMPARVFASESLPRWLFSQRGRGRS